MRHAIISHFPAIDAHRNRRHRYNAAMRTAMLATVVLFAAIGASVARAEPTAPPATAPSTSPPTSPAKIAEFQGRYRFLSNFWPAEIEFEGLKYPTVEHAYQSAKSLDMNERRRIAALPTPADAKAAGRALQLRDDWERVKFDVMEQCVRQKFTRHADLRRQLLDTGAAILEEGNTWGDRVWGVYQGEGDNRLGKILMKVRDELRPDGSASDGR
jgi:ribA/ribD-fused uncharacterized protein